MEHEAEKSSHVINVGLPGEWYEEVTLRKHFYLCWFLKEFLILYLEGTQEVDESQTAWVDRINFDECQENVESRQDF